MATTQLTLCIVTLRAFRPIPVQYPRPISDAYLTEIQQPPDAKDGETLEPQEEAEIDPMGLSGADLDTSMPPTSRKDAHMSQTDTPDVPMRFVEKKRLHWSGKTCKWFRSVGGSGDCTVLGRAHRPCAVDNSGQPRKFQSLP